MAYRGNPNLKKPGVQYAWEPWQEDEILKCSEDPIYFIEKYMKVVHVDHGLVPFILYDYQKEMINLMHKERYVAAVMARQSGKSTAVCGYLTWYVIFNESKEVGILANKGDTARKMLGKIQLAYQHLPTWIKHGVVEWMKGAFVLENGSTIYAASSSDDNVRGYSFAFVYLDECAIIEHYEDFAASVLPTISSGKTTKIVMTSTPFGLNHFWKIVELGKRKDAIEQKDRDEWNGYHVMEVPWTRVPGRDDEWKRDTLRQLNFDTEKFEQEYNIQFQGSSGTLIAGWKLKELVHRIPIHQKEGLLQYEQPKKDGRYFISADVSEGKGLDYSAFQVIDITSIPYNQVCTFRDNFITPVDFAAYIHGIAKMYNEAAVLIEINSLGEGVAWTLFADFEYPNLLFTENAGKMGKKLTSGLGSKKADKGIRVTQITKRTGCSMLKLLVEQNQLIINDYNTIYELNRFSRHLNTYQAEEGEHDDTVMPLVNFGWVTNQLLFKELTDINTLMKLREISAAQMEEDMLPFDAESTDGTEEIFDDWDNRDTILKVSFMNNF